MSTFFVGQRIEPGMLPFIEDIYRIDTPVERRWFIAWTAPQSEARAADAVQEAGFEPYRPLRTYWAKRDRRTRRIARRQAPAMPGYLFVRMPAEGAFVRLCRCIGVHGLVTCQGTPAAIPAEWIEQLREREADGEFDVTRRRRSVRNDKSPFPDWVFPGALIRIADGPFNTFIAKVVDAVSEGRLRAEVAIFGRQTITDLELAQVSQL